VLVPELTKRFFAHLNAESPGDGVHLEALQDDQLNNQNPFVCLARFVGIPLAPLVVRNAGKMQWSGLGRILRAENSNGAARVDGGAVREPIRT
jgi:hypothetical protein